MIEGKRVEIWSGGQRLVIDRKKLPGVYQPTVHSIRACCDGPDVVLLIGDTRLQMTTPVAVKVGLALGFNGGAWLEPDDAVLLEVSGIEVLLLPETAVRISGAILRKANQADDWQRAAVH